tara:strand:- start:867 stop:1052 length:186 start_codon:yes stop_codon:yes gene_type:complete
VGIKICYPNSLVAGGSGDQSAQGFDIGEHWLWYLDAMLGEDLEGRDFMAFGALVSGAFNAF